MSRKRPGDAPEPDRTEPVIEHAPEPAAEDLPRSPDAIRRPAAVTPEKPRLGGSYVRRPDGTLAKKEA